MIVGVVVAFVLDSLDTGLRSIAEIESVIELPSLAIIPKARRTAADQAPNLTRCSAQHQRPDAAEVAVRRILPFPTNFASAFDHGTATEIYPLYQFDPVRG